MSKNLRFLPLSKPVPEDSRLSLKIDASAAFGRIRVFLGPGLGPSHSNNLLTTACAILSPVALRKHIFTGNPESPPVYFPCSPELWGCLHWTSMPGAAEELLSPWALLCVWVVGVDAASPSWVPSSAAMLLKASCGCCSHRHCCSVSCQPLPVLKTWAIATSDCFSCVLQVTYG